MLPLRHRLRVVGANPLKRCLPVHFDFDTEVDRRIYCRYYDDCLDFAVAEQWASWSCKSCAVQENITEDERRAQMFAILKSLQLGR